MCGLFGVISKTGRVRVERARQCLEGLEHRGPDGSGEYTQEGVFIGHRRLSILDVTSAGDQPMSDSGVIITVNGEIYNYKELKSELEGKYFFNSGSDSEVVLHGYREWGIEGLLSRLDGMFAFVIWDSTSETVYMARDRVGIKPLYYSLVDSCLVWSSELHPIEIYHELTESDVRAESYVDFLTYRYIPAPYTIYKNVKKLEPASYLKFDLARSSAQITGYWHEPEQSTQTLGGCVDELEYLLKESVSQQMISDVPLGVFLSGGVDSGLISALACKTKGVETFSIAFDNPLYDESSRISSTADFLKCKNHMALIEALEAGELMRSLPSWFSEPFSDMSAVPTYKLCGHAAKKVKVCLSGDGADELFLGYPRFFNKKLLGPRRGGRLSWFSSSSGWGLAGRLSRLIDQRFVLRGVDLHCVLLGGIHPDESRKAAHYLGVSDEYDRFWKYKEIAPLTDYSLRDYKRFEFKSALPEMMLAKVDRVSMRNSLEVRVPYLSNKIVDFSFRVNDEKLSAPGKEKFLLREMASKYLPSNVSLSPKKGFGIPPELRLSEVGDRCSTQFKVLELTGRLDRFGGGVK